MITGHDLSIGRRNAVIRRAALACARHAMLLALRALARGARGRAVGAVVHATGVLRLGLLVLRRLDVDVGDAACFAVLRNGLVLVGRLGVLGDDVPGVQETRDEAQNGEEDVDEGVGAADAAFDPDCGRSVA